MPAGIKSFVLRVQTGVKGAERRRRKTGSRRRKTGSRRRKTGSSIQRSS
jgi:hypothetical protein